MRVAARSAGPAAAALAGWVVLLVVARWWGVAKAAGTDSDLKLDAIPLYGQWDPLITVALVVPIVVGALAAWALPWLALARSPQAQAQAQAQAHARLGWRWSWTAVLGAVGVAAVGWSLALAVVDPVPAGWSDIEQAYGRHAGLVDEAGGPGAFLSGYVARQPEYPVHLQAHPPGLVLLLWALGRAGLGGVGGQAVLAMVAVAACAVAALVVARDVADEESARSAAPFVVLVPAAVWHLNADVIVAAVALIGTALVTRAACRGGRWWWSTALGGGIVLGLAVMLSYGAALFALPVLAIGVCRRAWAVLGVAGAASVAMVLSMLGWGFWWWDGLLVTGRQYAAGVAAVRGYEYFLLANPAVFALALGPAVVVALAVLRDRRVWLVAGSGLAMVAVATVTGLSSGEVERIWQPFVPLVAVAGGALAAGGRVDRARVWLAGQVAVAVILQAALRSPW